MFWHSSKVLQWNLLIRTLENMDTCIERPAMCGPEYYYITPHNYIDNLENTDTCKIRIPDAYIYSCHVIST